MHGHRVRDLVDLLDEIVWRFGGQGSEGYCCEDIAYVEYRALRVIAGTDHVTMRDLGRQLGVTKSGATRVVDRMERAGYVKRERNQDDHRVCCVALTEAGKALITRVLEEYARRVETSVARLDDEMLDILMAALRRFVRSFRD